MVSLGSPLQSQNVRSFPSGTRVVVYQLGDQVDIAQVKKPPPIEWVVSHYRGRFCITLSLSITNLANAHSQ